MSDPRPDTDDVPCPRDLDALVATLEQCFRGGARPGGQVTRLLAAYGSARRDWEPFALFGDEGYTRNLIARTDAFELLLLCWGEGQESPIHNHEGQDCWMAVLDGHIEELRYPMPEPGYEGPLVPRETHAYDAGQVAFIRDEMGLHLVRPQMGRGRAVSLHLYAAPYEACNVYCPETGRITRRELADHSVRGRVTAAR